MTNKIWCVAVVFVIATGLARAADFPSAPSGPVISAVVIGGNDRVEEEAIRVLLHSRPGEPLNEDTVDKDIRAVYG
uniref:POTRA domain-containing protein n=1 Tax=Salmonella sp. SAL4457 TaxID=3159912 RepID=UPI00397C1CC1